MELRQIRCFLAVADERSMTKAAKILNMAQPPLSRKIKQMEVELGMALFIRDKDGLKLTECGRLLYRRGSEIIKLAGKVEQELEEMKSGRSRNISVAAVQSLGTTWMPAVIKKYSKVYPEIGFNVYIGNSDEIKKRLDSGRYDIGIMREPFAYNSEEYERIELAREYWCILMKKENILAGKENLQIKDLHTQKLLLPMRAEIRQKLQQWLKINDMDGQIFCNYSELMTAVVLVKEGLGVAVVSNTMNHIFGSDEQLVMREINDTECVTISAAIWKKGSALSDPAKQFIKYIRDMAEENVLQREEAGKEHHYGCG